MLNVNVCKLQMFNWTFIMEWLMYVCIHIAGDSAHDLTILTNQSQFIAWAIGPRATEAGLGNLAFFHTEYPRNGGTNFV